MPREEWRGCTSTFWMRGLSVLGEIFGRMNFYYEYCFANGLCLLLLPSQKCSKRPTTQMSNGESHRFFEKMQHRNRGTDLGHASPGTFIFCLTPHAVCANDCDGWMSAKHRLFVGKLPLVLPLCGEPSQIHRHPIISLNSTIASISKICEHHRIKVP